MVPQWPKAMEMPFQNDRIDGQVVEWYTNGNKKASTVYSSGIRQGSSSEFYESGKKKLDLFTKTTNRTGKELFGMKMETKDLLLYS